MLFVFPGVIFTFEVLGKRVQKKHAPPPLNPVQKNHDPPPPSQNTGSPIKFFNDDRSLKQQLLGAVQIF